MPGTEAMRDYLDSCVPIYRIEQREPWATLVNDRPVFDKATRLRAAHRLKSPDALHLAAAIESHCTQFWTNDRRLAAAAAGHLEVHALSA